MHNTADVIHSPDQTADAQGLFTLQVQRALDEIKRSAHFRGSKQSQQLLQYIVTESLDGHVERLKERIIGAEVFGRPVDYETNVDPIVRSRAAEVRKRLAQYYVEEGKDSPIRIKLSPGAYFAHFSDLSKTHSEEVGFGGHAPVLPQIQREVVEAENFGRGPSLAVAHPGRRKRQLQIAAIALALMAVATITYNFWPKSQMEEFWSPLLKNPKPILIYTGANPVYMPSTQLIERFKATHHVSELDTGGNEFLVPLAGDTKIGEGDLTEVENQFVTVGDVSANVRVTSVLNHFNHAFDLRSGGDVAFGDFRESPVVLIGAFNNPWTLQMTGDLPIVFGSGLTIRDRADKSIQWRPEISSENKVGVDYALVARLPHSRTGGPLITIAGITLSGTRAAAEFITSPQGVSDLTKSAPNGWSQKNLEFVLQTKVVNDIPTTPSVVAVRAW
jgi:hypothetical protein